MEIPVTIVIAAGLTAGSTVSILFFAAKIHGVLLDIRRKLEKQPNDAVAVIVGILREIASKLDKPIDPAVAIASIAKLDVSPGDVVVLRIAGRPSNSEVHHVSDIMKSVLPSGVECVILHSDVEISVLAQAG